MPGGSDEDERRSRTEDERQSSRTRSRSPPAARGGARSSYDTTSTFPASRVITPGHRHIDSACSRRIYTLVTCIYLSKIQRGGLPHRRQRLRRINTLVACIYLSTIQRGGLPHRRHTDVLTTTAMSSYVVFPAAANSTSLPSAPGQEFQVATCPTSPIASDANDILNHSFFLPRSLHMIFTCDIYIPLLLTPPSCVYRFLWERTVSIIFTHLISPFLFTPFIYLEGLYHGQSEPEVDLYLSTLPVRVHTHTYTYIYIFLSRLEICE